MGLYKFVQEFCNKYGFTDYDGKKLVVDDIPGERSKSAVKKFQTKAKQLGIYNYAIDGEALEETKKAMRYYDSKKGNIPLPVSNKPKVQLQWEDALGKTFTVIKGAYNAIIGTGYGHYNNDELSYDEVLASFKGKISRKPNCTDLVQAFKKLADAMGYETRYIHKICQSGEGHITLEIRGKDIGTSWIEIDPAAAISVGSQYPWSKVWCPYPKERWVSTEAWLTGPDDGNMG